MRCGIHGEVYNWSLCYRPGLHPQISRRQSRRDRLGNSGGVTVIQQANGMEVDLPGTVQ